MLLKIKGRLNKCRKDQRGFTLVELIVVMAILVLLGTLAVPQFRTVLADARTDANATNLHMLQNAVDIYISSEGLKPADVDDFQLIIDKKYLKAAPVPPAGFTDYTVTDGVVAGGDPEPEPEA